MHQQMFEIQYRNYPAIISLLKETEKQGRVNARRYSLSIVSKYNRDLKEFINLINISPNLFAQGKLSIGLVVRILKNIRRDYLKRIDISLRLNIIEKIWLKNYIIGKYRESVNPFIK